MTNFVERKKIAYLFFILLFFLVFSLFVFAYGTGGPPSSTGHDFQEMQGVQAAIADGMNTCAGANLSIKTINYTTGVVTCELDDIGVAGTGSYRYVPMWNDPSVFSSSLGNSLIYDAPAGLYPRRLGINTVSPINALVNIEAASDDLHGLYVHTSAPTPKYGVYASSLAPSGIGVYAEGGTGVQGTSISSGTGVFGSSDSGYGVYGRTLSTTGSTYGVYGITASSDGVGVYGWATNTLANPTGFSFGVVGTTESPTGYGVYGMARSVSGTALRPVGVGGRSDSVSGSDFSAEGDATVNYGVISSQRWKKNVQLIKNPLEKVQSMRGVYFDWDEDHGNAHDFGMIAEEVGKVLPEAVSYEENGIDAYSMDYSKLTPFLVEAIKEQQKIIEQQQRELDELKRELDELNRYLR